MTVSQSQVNFIDDTRTQSWISRATGIPRSTISKVSRGVAKLPRKYAGEVRRLYRREAYRRIREAGVNSVQGTRLKSYRAKSVHSIIDKINTKVSYLARGHMTSWHKPVFRDGIELYGEDKYIRIQELLRESLRASPKSYETQQRY